jgi:hypothetical protein
MIKIIILLFVLSSILSFDYLTQTISLPSLLSSVQAQENSLENGIDLTGIWERDDGEQVYITQTDSEVIGRYSEMLPCEGLENSETDFVFQGTIDGNQVIGEESAWCYSDSSNPDENGLFIDPFEATISDDSNQLTLSVTNRFTREEQSVSFSKISEPEGVEASPTDDQGSSTTDQLRDTFTSTFSQVKEPLTSLQENDLPQLLLLTVLGVAVIGGTAAYAKHRSSMKSQQEEEQANIVVITRGGIE